MSTDSDYYLDLNIDVTNALSNSLDLSKLRKTGEDPNGSHDIWYIPKKNLKEVFNHQWLSQLEKDTGLDLRYALIFYKTNHYFHPHAHIDTLIGNGENQLNIIQYGLNFVYDQEDDSEMIWYELDPRDESIKDAFIINNGRSCCTWDLNKFYGREIARKTIGRNLVLVNTSVPHTIETRQKTRWCFSLRFKDLDTLSFPECVKKLSKFSL